MSFRETNLQKFAQNEQYQPSVAQSNIKPLSSREGFQAILAKFKSYEPRSNILDLKKLHQSGYLKLKKYKDSAYYGEIVNGKRHGMGVMLYSNDRIYQGEWQSDYKNGKGYEEFQNGCIYQGYYVNGKPEGVGKHQWPNGEFYEGQWLSGLKHGSGMWFGAKGDNYVGEWKFGKADGYGVHVWINGDRYEGEFKQCLKHGSGTEKFASGELYKGDFYRGKPNGYGQFFWPNGSYYKGNFINGLRDGHGIWKLSSGNSDKYEGQYVNGKKHGYGIFTWYAGNIYKGNYFEDEREGYGEMYWTDGSYYKGHWHKGNQEGQGIIFTPTEGIKKGIFRHNELVQVIIEQQPVINVPLRIRKKKPRPKNMINSNQATPFQEKRKHSPISSLKKYVSLELGSKSPQSNARLRQKLIKHHFTNRGNSSYHHKQGSSRRIIKSPQRVSEFKSYAFNSKEAHEHERKNLTTIQEIRKDHVPHSSIYMHKIDKRRSALGSPADSKTDALRNHHQQTSQYREVKPLIGQASGRLHQSTIL